MNARSLRDAMPHLRVDYRGWDAFNSRVRFKHLPFFANPTLSIS